MTIVKTAHALLVLLLLLAGLSGCGEDDARTAVREANKVRVGKVGQFTDGACRQAETRIPAARRSFHAARRALLQGEPDRAQSIVSEILRRYGDKLAFDVRLLMKTCQATLG